MLHACLVEGVKDVTEAEVYFPLSQMFQRGPPAAIRFRIRTDTTVPRSCALMGFTTRQYGAAVGNDS